MSDLDTIDEVELREEIARRKMLRTDGKCDYCGRPRGSIPACRFGARHQLRCEAVSKSARGVRDGKVCTKARNHGTLFHQSEDGAMWSER